jgi:hypothetical protein
MVSILIFCSCYLYDHIFRIRIELVVGTCNRSISIVMQVIDVI